MPKVTNEVLNEINLPIKLVHMVRNPYDNIATMTLRSLNVRSQDAHAAKNKVSNEIADNILVTKPPTSREQLNGTDTR